eukprot:CAMPEP_0197692766 /NCGR_PEP_ID=MMETSP1338-20131121/111567_1 /TAXON_ID=43686 ORGANISM="Pelagodinium beii, Strain RCC1491" /NCGR_SAMPLE_ID=MMETSP1338 /ASSEMBLY_ACC=CAM_ASM_000754 /LENGTH=193 /DNA_ID=CAMNT_0043275455 /DNA_START=79 /DNA_END=659 /DNA_ORIENTATION=+
MALSFRRLKSTEPGLEHLLLIAVALLKVAALIHQGNSRVFGTAYRRLDLKDASTSTSQASKVVRFASGARGVRRTIPRGMGRRVAFESEDEQYHLPSNDATAEEYEEASPSDMVGWLWFDYPGEDNAGIWFKDEHLIGMEEADEAETETEYEERVSVSEGPDSDVCSQEQLQHDEDGDVAHEFWVENRASGAM